jgi:hypothetical protein
MDLPKNILLAEFPREKSKKLVQEGYNPPRRATRVRSRKPSSS